MKAVIDGSSLTNPSAVELLRAAREERAETTVGMDEMFLWCLILVHDYVALLVRITRTALRLLQHYDSALADWILERRPAAHQANEFDLSAHREMATQGVFRRPSSWRDRRQPTSPALAAQLEIDHLGRGPSSV